MARRPLYTAVAAAAAPRRNLLRSARFALTLRLPALGFMAGLVGAWNLASAQTPPVQHIYPHSTLQEIQQAIDNGGTVFFHYGEYNQIASSTPDLPPTPANPAKGFNIGKYGKDVNIIGLSGPNGERPKINGGTVAFRVGLFPEYGFVGLPVNFRIENLELLNPDLHQAGTQYSRLGIFVRGVLGAQTTITNCKIIVTGKDTDPSHAINISSAIWFWLGGAQRPPSGARIDITNNEIHGTKVRMGIGLGHFFAETPDYTPPRFVLDNNTVEVEGLRGYGGSGGAIHLHGGLPNSVVTNNAVRGDARSPGFAYVSIGIFYQRGQEFASSNITVVGNDASGFLGDFQLYLARTVSGGMIHGNAFGSAGLVGVLCYGHENWFEDNHFYGAYPGWEPAGSGPGLLWFANTNVSTSHGNKLVATKLNEWPYGFDVCCQVYDETDDPSTPGYDGANQIPGYERCQKKSVEFIQRMQERKAEIEARLAEDQGPVLPPD